MPLTSGTRLDQYEIVSVIGAGGMGEVYRARDTKLGRDDVDPRTGRLVMIRRSEESASADTIRLIVNWTKELRDALPR